MAGNKAVHIMMAGKRKTEKASGWRKDRHFKSRPPVSTFFQLDPIFYSLHHLLIIQHSPFNYEPINGLIN
jgi:hypothetical protein